MEIFTRILALAAGLSLLWEALRAAVGVMLVPRPIGQRLSRWVARSLALVFHACARRLRTYEQLDRFLAVQGPVSVLLFLTAFLAIFVAAFSLIFYGLGGASPLQAFYLAGSGMTTLGLIGVPGAWHLATMVVAAFMGTTAISVFIGYLLTLYSAYTAREAGMSAMTLISGEPAWGPELLVRAHRLEVPIDERVVVAWIKWMCAVRIGQYIYSILNHFRSPLPERHWAVTMLAMCDAAAIRLSAVQNGRELSLVRVVAEGADSFQLLQRSEMARLRRETESGRISPWDIETQILKPKDAGVGAIPDAGVTRAEWNWAMDFLADNGVPLIPDREAAWQTFCHIRSLYVGPAYFLADVLFAVPAPWSGPRHRKTSAEFTTMWPQLAAERRRGKPLR